MSYTPAAIVDDWIVTGGTARSTLGDNLLAASGSAAYDTFQAPTLGTARSMYVQINASSGISSGQIIIEGSNDNTNFTVLFFYNDGNGAAIFNTAATTIAASTTTFFSCKLPYRYVRVRISTAFVGGTLSAIARFSTSDFVPRINAVAQGTASGLRAQLGGATTGGLSTYTNSLTNTATAIKGSQGTVYAYDFHNPNAAISYVQMFNTLVGSVTVGTTPPFYSIGIPANGRATFSNDIGIQHSTAVVLACTTTRTGNTAPASTVDLNVFYT